MSNVTKHSIRASDPRGYLSCFRQVGTNCPIKRFCVNEYVRQIYAWKGTVVSFQDGCQHHQQRWKTLDILMKTPQFTSYEASVARVKRQLFRQPKRTQRKQARQQICRKVVSETECLHYKSQRHKFGSKKIPRRYLDDAMSQICQTVREKLTPRYKKIQELYEHINTNEDVRHNLKRKWSELEDLTQHVIAEDKAIVESDEIVKKVRRFRLDDEIEQKATHKLLQASDRSLRYIEKIMAIIVEYGQIDEDYLAM